jgi:2-oxoglutarate ferredoxin oxidoreductase subunit delta
VTSRGRGLIRGTVVIETERCKGCELCITACPPQVLVMSTEVNTSGYAYPRLLEGCTGCRACVNVCPDFVFEVYKYDTPLAVGAKDASSEAVAGLVS